MPSKMEHALMLTQERRTWYLRPIDRDLCHRDPQPLGQVDELYVKAPPLQAHVAEQQRR